MPLIRWITSHRLALLGSVVFLTDAGANQAAEPGRGGLQLQVAMQWQGREWRQGAEAADVLEVGTRLKRLDLLLSGLALRRADGSWLVSEDWQGFASAEKTSVLPPATGVPAGSYTAIRFEVGVPAEINAADPAQWPVGHPLHAEVNGLHWGWQGGYIFLALEGLWQRPGGALDGFSYHLATDAHLTTVTLPVAFEGGGPVTLRLALEASVLLEGIDFIRDGTSTHSREGDALAARLAENLGRAFRLVSTHTDHFQSPAATADSAQPLPVATPLRLDITQRFPQVHLPADNPLTVEGAALGEALFHDTRLSVNNTQSCASCHDRALAFSDSRRVSPGAQGQAGKRQSMPLFNLAWSRAFFWDGRAASLREQVLMPVTDPHEMNETLERAVAKISDQEPLFEKAFGTPKITPNRMARALEQYLLTLVSQDSRFDRAARQTAALTEEEKRGLQLFVTEHDPKRGLFGADCFHCHGGTLFTDHDFKNNGLELTADDLGRMAVSGRAADRGKFKTPSLRNIAATAPYMHDGRFQTLEQVVAHYNGPLHRTESLDPNLAKHPQAGIQLSAADQRALVAFLKTLTDEAFLGSGSTNGALAKQP